METKFRDYVRAEVYRGRQVNVLQKFYQRYISPIGNAQFLIRKRLCAKSQLSRRFYEVLLIRRYGIAVGYGGGVPSVDIGLTIPHPMAINIAVGAKIGKNCTLHQCVTIGASESKTKGYGFPTIGDNVTIYANAVIIGKVTIGDGTTIAAGAVVTRDTEANSTYAGVPAKRIS
jgi:serine O-acetyltransferase